MSDNFKCSKATGSWTSPDGETIDFVAENMRVDFNKIVIEGATIDSPDFTGTFTIEANFNMTRWEYLKWRMNLWWILTKHSIKRWWNINVTFRLT